MSKVDAFREFTSVGEELEAMKMLGEVLDKLDNNARERVMNWIDHRYPELRLNDCQHCDCNCVECKHCGPEENDG